MSVYDFSTQNWVAGYDDPFTDEGYCNCDDEACEQEHEPEYDPAPDEAHDLAKESWDD
jgi:hypothetical protein